MAKNEKPRRRIKSPSPAKITPPAVADAYPRTRLFAALDGAFRARRLIWVAAPAGAGKTTLAMSYIESRRRHCLWYQVDTGDRDLATFFHYLAIAGAKRAPRSPRRLPALTPEYVGGEGVFARNFFRELCRRMQPPFVLVFDNLQEVADVERFHEVLSEGLTELPRGGHALLLSRTDPSQAFARLRVNRQLTELGWSDMRVAEEELTPLARVLGAGEMRSSEIEAVYRRCDGWIAGLILLLQGSEQNRETAGAATAARSQKLFDYFAAEVFGRRPPVVREFLMLTALLPAFTAGMAARLTGYARAAALLTDLARQHHFTERRSESSDDYQFHPLFREFLLGQAQDAFGPAELAHQRHRAAAILEQAGRLEDAVPLYLSAGDFDAAARLLLVHAFDLAAAGRHATLAALIEQLPPGTREREPWLLYWYGLSRLPVALAEARGDLGAAYRAFEARNDSAGLYLTWTAIVESFFIEFRNYLAVDEWIGTFTSLRQRFPEYPSLEVELRVLHAAIGALVHRHVHHPLLPALTERLEALMQTIPDPSQRGLLGVHAFLYHVELGRLERAQRLLSLMGHDASVADPVARITWCTCAAMAEWLRGNPRESLPHIDEGLTLIDEHGLPVLRLLILNQGIHAALACGDLQRANRFLEQMRAIVTARDDVDASLYHYPASMVAAHRGDAAEAEAHAAATARLAHDRGVPFGYFCGLFVGANAAFLRGDDRKARELLGAARAIGTEKGSPWMDFVCRFTECAFSLDNQDRHTGLAALREVIALSGELRMPGFPWLPRRVLARVFGTALEHDIEQERVKVLIRNLEVAATDDVLHVHAWPWPVKVHTLGRFTVLLDDEPLRFSAKAPKKPLELLKVLIALGGRRVQEGTAAEALWPHAEAGSAALALTTTLHRLRKLIGDGAVERRDGCLTLDSRTCWVDVWAVERQLTAVQRASRGSPPEAIAESADSLLALYRGPFLAEEREEYWVLSRRERLCAKFRRTMALASQVLIEARLYAPAIERLERCLEIDPLAEDFYRRIMQAYCADGRSADALAAYERCRAALAARFGRAPSPGIEALRRRALAGPP